MNKDIKIHYVVYYGGLRDGFFDTEKEALDDYKNEIKENDIDIEIVEETQRIVFSSRKEK